MEVVRATIDHLDALADLFDCYRQFYEQQPDLSLAREFIKRRILNNESIIFLAKENDEGMGFVQLYPSFCSVDAMRIYILYDLFVATEHRKKGVGEALMNRATQLANETNAGRIDLLTDKSNLAGQHLYEKLGYYQTNQSFYAYSLDI